MNQNMMEGMFVPGFNNNKPPYPNQVSRETYNGENGDDSDSNHGDDGR